MNDAILQFSLGPLFGATGCASALSGFGFLGSRLGRRVWC